MKNIIKKMLFKIFGKQRIKNWNVSIRHLLTSEKRKSFSKLEANFRYLSSEATEELRKHLRDNYFKSYASDYLSTEIGIRDMEDLVINRLNDYRKNSIPWLSSLLPLPKTNILEIGCGTGCATIALAEQGANLTSIDIIGEHIIVARKRCELHGVSAKFATINAGQINELNEKYDFIIFSACLEHMTYNERTESINQAWSILNNGGYLVVLETPNRLHYDDGHSSLLKFYQWLPDELAMKYAKYSPRQACVDVGDSNDYMRLIRFGRGVSFHEFEIALGISCGEMIVSDRHSFNKPVFSSGHHRNNKKWIKILQKIGPVNVPVGFYHECLYIALRKPIDAFR
jgi:S-adenosylmethionine-dependent methyltransferase